MKGINLKNIGAIVAGATILASSVAYAGLMYQNTELVNSDGQPVAKVVLGANAMASDAVVASLISNKMANEAYKTTTFTAKSVGEGTCSGGATGTGTCTVKEGSETVTLQITVPGAGLEGQHKFVNAIGDFVDRGLENRYTSMTDSDEAYTVLDDFEDEDGNPFQNFLGSTLTNAGDFDVTNDIDFELYDIGNMNFAPFADVELTNSRLNKKYTEKQDFWVNGKVKWDEADHALYGDVVLGAYTVLFDSKGDYGLPICPGDEEETWGNCAGTTNSLQAHRVFVRFMGEDWVISEIDGIADGVPASLNPCTAAPGVCDKEVYQVDNAKVKLAKEAKYGIINVGEIMEAPNGYKIRLDDISRETGFDNAHPAIITVLDANDNEVCQDQVYPGETKQDLCDTPTGVKLHIYQTAPGLNFIAKWAEMAIYSDEIELESNENFLDATLGDDTDWKVYLGWTNKGDTGEGYDPEYLRSIYIYNVENNQDQMDSGDVFPVTDLEGYEAYDLTYNGIDDEDAAYDTLDVKLFTNKQWTIQDTSTTTCTFEADEGLEFKSSTGEFKIENSMPYNWATTKTLRGSQFYYVQNADWAAGTCAPVTVDDFLVFLDSSDNKKYLVQFDIDGLPGGLGADLMLPVVYKQAGSDGHVVIYQPGSTQSLFPEVWLASNAGKYDSTEIMDGMGFEYDTVQEKLLSTVWVGTPEKDEVSYLTAYQTDVVGNNDDILGWFTPGIVPAELGYESMVPFTTDMTYEQGFVGMRGTQFTSGSDASKKFKVPKTLLKATWTFSTVSTADMPADTHEYTLHEGEEASVGTTGVKVKVLSIDEVLNPCTAGAGAGGAPTCDMSTVSAVVMPNNAPSATGAVPYALTSNLVYLDSDNVALDTGVIITVGGDKVNTVTKGAIAGSDVDFAATPVVVKQIGNKIVVAGLNPEDTMAAGQQFVAALTKA